MNHYYLLILCSVGIIIFITDGSAAHSANIRSDTVKAAHDVVTQRAQKSRWKRATADGTERQLIPNISSPWPKHLRSTLSVTELLGQLIVESTGIDFNLKEASVANGTLLIPAGFRPSMIQLTNEAHRTLRAIRNEMQSLKVSVSRIPDAIKQISSILRTGDTQKASRSLSVSAKTITNAVRASSESNRNMDEKMIQLIDLILETCKRLSDKIRDLHEALRVQISSDDQRKLLQSRLSAAQSTVGVASDLLFKKADDLGWFFVAFNVVIVNLKQRTESFVDFVKRISHSHYSVNETAMIGDLLQVEADHLATVSRYMRIVAEVHVHVFDRYVLAPERLRFFSALQHLSKSQAKRKLRGLINENKVAWRAIQKLVQQKRRNEKVKASKFGKMTKWRIVPSNKDRKQRDNEEHRTTTNADVTQNDTIVVTCLVGC